MKSRIIILLLIFAPWGCDESLPPRNDPEQVLQTSFQVVFPGTVVIRDSIPAGMPGAFSSSVKNVYREVLQDTQRVRLDVEVWLKDQPAARATIHATANDLVSPWLVRGSLLTLGIDTAAVVQKQWSHRTDAGVPFWNYADMFPGVTMGGESYCESASLRFVARATVQAFKNVQPTRLPEFEYDQVYRVFGITCVPPTVEKK
jgi:hypothetical protein